MLADWLIVINGESNSGGYALNSEARPEELLPRPAVQILDNHHLRSFEPLHVGVNNLTGHAGLEPYCCQTHGLELELASRAEMSPSHAKPVHLVKTGQGGSMIAQWAADGAYFQTFCSRIRVARVLLADQVLRPVILFSLGINDALAGTPIPTWKAAVMAHFAAMRKLLGGDTPIIMTKFMHRYAAYNAAIDEICRNTPETYAIDTLDASLRDENHWDYRGMKLVAGRMLDRLEALEH